MEHQRIGLAVEGLTKDQKAMRRNLITGSRIAKLVGMSPYGGPLDVYREMVEGYEPSETRAMKRGRMLECSVLSWYAEDTGAELTSPGTLIHPKHNRIGATPDALASKGGDPWVVEAKTASLRMADKFGEPGTDDIPDHYLCQVQLELCVTGLPYAEVPVLIGGEDLKVYRVDGNETLQGLFIEAGLRFIRDHIDKKVPPSPGGDLASTEYLKARFPKETKPPIIATAEVESIALAFKAACEEHAEVEERRAALRNQLKLVMGPHESLRGSFGAISWRKIKDSSKVDYEALATALSPPEELVRKYTTVQAGYRRFAPTWKKVS